MDSEALIEKINEITSRPTMSDWSLGFCESIVEQLNRGRKLSDKQFEVLTKVFEQNSLDEVEKLKNWSIEYREKYVNDAVLLAKYYTHSGYYTQLASVILSGDVPSYRTFFKMYNNKYAKKIVAESRRPARFMVGDHVIANSLCSHAKIRECNKSQLVEYKAFHRFKNLGGMILEIDHGTVLSPAKGAKRYRILPIASTDTFWIEERFVKKGRVNSKKVS